MTVAQLTLVGIDLGSCVWFQKYFLSLLLPIFYLSVFFFCGCASEYGVFRVGGECDGNAFAANKKYAGTSWDVDDEDDGKSSFAQDSISKAFGARSVSSEGKSGFGQRNDDQERGSVGRSSGSSDRFRRNEGFASSKAGSDDRAQGFGWKRFGKSSEGTRCGGSSRSHFAKGLISTCAGT